MIRKSAVCLLLFVGSATAAPVPREELRPPVQLAGGIWEGDGVVAPTVYEFHPDGTMTLTYNGTRYSGCGTWKQTGKDIYWETNKQFCEFQGKLSGTTITGESWNVAGGKWILTVKRKPPPTKP